MNESVGSDTTQRPGVLYVCATPIGNLGDITLRALKVLQKADLVAAEDTRRTRALLSHYGITRRVVSYYEHNKEESGLRIIGQLLESKDCVLVTDAGTPSVSDPGSDLVAKALDAGIKVSPLPGPSAVSAALSVSGLDTDRFVFVGFLPRKAAALQALLNEHAFGMCALVAYESPNRLLGSLETMSRVLADRRLVITRELTKVHEEVFRGTAESALLHFGSKEVLGEITIVIEGLSRSSAVAATKEGEQNPVVLALRSLLLVGVSVKEATDIVSKEAKVAKNDVYALALNIRKELENVEDA